MANYSNFWGKSISIVIVLAMVFSTVTLFSEEVKAEPLDLDYECLITVTDLRAPPYYRVAFTDKPNNITLTLRNDDNANREIVSVNIFHVEPDGLTEHFLTTVSFGALQPDMEKTKDVFDNGDGWIPTQTGRNWISGEIYVKGHGNDKILVDVFKESFNVVPGWRPVIHIEGDWVIDEPTVVENKTVIVDGDVYVNAPTSMNYGTLIAGDFTVNDEYTIGPIEDVDLACEEDGQFKVEVNPSGILNVLGKIWNNDYNNHYWFYMNGTLEVDAGGFPGYGIIENTYGPSNLNQPGGIICTTDNVLIKDGATIRNGKTHGIYLHQGSDAVIKNSFIVDNGLDYGGDGIVVIDGSAPQIEGNNISWNGRFGVYAKGSFPNITSDNNITYNGQAGLSRQDGIYIYNVISAEGKPSYTPAKDLGYFIWHDENGWQIRCSSDDNDHVFDGSITSDGDVTNFNRIVAAGSEESVIISDNTRANFDIYLDGQSLPENVFIGLLGVNPDSMPFELVKNVMIKDNNVTSNMASGIHCKDTNIPIINNTISFNGLGLRFSDDMEIGEGSWSYDPLWQRVSNDSGNAPPWRVSHSGDWSWWYGHEHGAPTVGDYDTGSTNSGSLTSEVISLVGVKSATLTFWSWYETDSLGDVTDQRWVEIQGSAHSENYQLYGEDMNTWTRHVLNLTEFKEETIIVSFFFDTINAVDNAFQGWYIDDVEVIAAYPPAAGMEHHGIHLEGQTSPYVYNNTITHNNQNGVYITSSHSIIHNNTVASNRMAGIRMFTSGSKDNVIINNTIIDCNFGISSTSGQRNTIINNTISQTTEGIYLSQSSSNTIINNTIFLSNIGLMFFSSNNNIIVNNSISDNSNGVYFYDSDSNIFANNTVSSNNKGIYLSTCKNINIVNNTISNNDYGIYLIDSAPNIVNCILDENNYGIYDTGDSTTFSTFTSGRDKEVATFIDGGYHDKYSITLPQWAVLRSASMAVEGIEIRNVAVLEDPEVQVEPAIHGDLLVWQDNRDGNWEIYAYDLSVDSDGNGVPNYIETPKLEIDPALVRITNNPRPQQKPDIWEDTIVWADARSGNYDIYAYSFSNDTEWVVVDHPATQQNPAIYGDHIVWHDGRNGNIDIFMKNISTGEESQLSTSDWHDMVPQIHKGNIVWYSYFGTPTGPEFADVYLFEIDKWRLTQITKDDPLQYGPSIYDQSIVWHDNRHGNWEIYHYDILGGSEERITKEDQQSFIPQMYEDRIVYYYHDRVKGFWSVRMYDMDTGIQTDIERETNGESKPVIYGDRIAWVNRTYGAIDIYVLDFSIVGYPEDVTLDIGCDGELEFSHPDLFDGTEYVDPSIFLTGLQSLLSGGWDIVDIPIGITSTATGRVGLGELIITYDLPTIIDNSTISNSITCGIKCDGSSPRIINSTLENNPTEFEILNDAHPTALNTTFTQTSVSFGDDLSTLTVQWFMDIHVIDSDFDPIDGASVEVKDVNDNIVFTGTSDIGGNCRRITCTEYTQTQTVKTYYSPYNVSASEAALQGWAKPEPPMGFSMHVYVMLGAEIKLHGPIRINSNMELVALATAENWPGGGRAGNPYIIWNYDIIGSGHTNCIYIGNTTKHFVVQNCYLHHASEDLNKAYFHNAGLYLHNVQNGAITNNIVTSNLLFGIYLAEGCSDITIYENTVRFHSDGIRVEYGCNYNSITDNLVSDNSWGIVVQGWSCYNTVSNNEVTKSSNIGIYVAEWSTGTIIENNRVHTDTGYGISASDGHDYIVNNNIVYSCQEGIHLNYSDSSEVTNNQVYDCSDIGIYFHHSNNNVFVGNTISDNSLGMYSTLLSTANLIYHNNFIDNTIQAHDDSSNFWNDIYPSGGNYWSDYDGRDVMSGPAQESPGSDGIGDEPYNSATGQGIQGGSNFDAYPLFAEMTINFEVGSNFISLPVIDPTLNGIKIRTAADLLQATGAIKVEAWDRESQSWIEYTTAHQPTDPENFDVLPDRAYFVEVANQKTLPLEGGYPVRPRSVSLVSGWNDVGYMDPYNYGDVESDWAWQVSCGALDDIAYWTGNTWDHYIYSGTVMDLVPSRGYMVWSDYETTLTY